MKIIKTEIEKMTEDKTARTLTRDFFKNQK